MENFSDLEVVYIEGNASDFVVFIQGLKDKAQIHAIDGHMRWVVTREDGTQYVARPSEIESE